MRFFSLLPILTLAAVATASPAELEARGGGECNTGPNYCCNTTQDASTLNLGYLNGLLGITLPPITGLVGLTCTSILSVAGSTCSQQPVCCTGNNFSGVIVVGCSPVTL